MSKEKFKYQNTYFILPFRFKQSFSKFLQLQLENNFSIECFEKMKDLEIFSFFQKEILNAMFYPMPKDINQMDTAKKVSFLEKKDCVILNYNLSTDTESTNDSKEYLQYSINDIKLIIFSTEIAFLAINTSLCNTNDVSDVINFNYRFKWILSSSDIQKRVSNIKISCINKEIDTIKSFVENKIGIELDSNNGGLWTDSFYTFSYLCLDAIYLNENTTNEQIAPLLYKYSKVLNWEYDIEGNIFDDQEKDIIKIYDDSNYTKIGITKIGSNLLTSGANSYNYTVLEQDYKTRFFYAYILALYQRMELIRLNGKIAKSSKKDRKIIQEQIYKFTKVFYQREITLSQKGMNYYNDLLEMLSIKTLHKGLMEKYAILFPTKAKRRKTNMVLFGALVVSVGLNVFQYIRQMELERIFGL